MELSLLLPNSSEAQAFPIIITAKFKARIFSY